MTFPLLCFYVDNKHMSTGVLNHPPSNSQRENKAVPPVFFHHPRARFYRENEILPGRSTPLGKLLPPLLKPPLFTSSLPSPAGIGNLWTGLFFGVRNVSFGIFQGIYLTAVGFAGGQTSFPTYTEVCSGKTNHTEVVQLVFDPSVCTYESLLKLFWESHDPTQGMRQGKDYGTQYRSLIGTTTKDQHQQAFASRHLYTLALFSQVSMRFPQKLSTNPSSIWPRTITSNISPKIPTVTVNSREPRNLSIGSRGKRLAD